MRVPMFTNRKYVHAGESSLEEKLWNIYTEKKKRKKV